MSHIKYIKCDNKNCDVSVEVDPIDGYSLGAWYILWSEYVYVDLCSYKCLQEYVGGMQ